ncbi:MAG: hypothetical protein ACYTFG_19555, partial [Planctomycetota bacterium]
MDDEADREEIPTAIPDPPEVREPVHTPPPGPPPGSPPPPRPGLPGGGRPHFAPPPPRPGAPRPGKGGSPILWILLVLGLFVLAISLLVNLVLGMSLFRQGLPGSTSNLVPKRIQGSGRDKILVINVSGVISSGGASLFMPS